MDNQLFLSIIIPVYNMEHYIVPCLESIFANRDIDKNLGNYIHLYSITLVKGCKRILY